MKDLKNLSKFNNRFKFLFYMIFLIFLIFFVSKSILAKDIYVDYSGEGKFTCIQEAIDTANESDIIYVLNGIYNENIHINKRIHLFGEGYSNTKIIGNKSNENTIKITANNVIVSGFSIDNTAGQALQYHCIFLQSVKNCTIFNNLVKNGENGIYLINVNNISIHENTIQNNKQKGIRLSSSNENILYNNIVQSNGDGIYLTGSGLNEIFENNILNNGYGVSLSAASNNNFIFNNNFDNKGCNAFDSGSNIWSLHGNGNYWSNYQGYDNDHDGIGDIPYIIDENSQDNFPLMESMSQESNSDNDFPSSSNLKPIAMIITIDPSEATYGDEILFQGYGKDTDGTITDYKWRSNIDGVLNNESTFLRSSLSIGTHMIYFKVKDDDNTWSDEVTFELLVVDPVLKNIEPISCPGGPYCGENNCTVIFNGSTSYDVDGEIVLFEWDFGDNCTGYGSLISHVYEIAGNYSVNLTVTDDKGATAFNETTVSIYKSSAFNESQESNKEGQEKNIALPGFEPIFMLISILFLVYLIKRKKL